MRDKLEKMAVLPPTLPFPQQMNGDTMLDNGPSEIKRMKTDEELMLGMVGRDGFFIKVTLKYDEYFHVTYRRSKTHCI